MASFDRKLAYMTSRNSQHANVFVTTLTVCAPAGFARADDDIGVFNDFYITSRKSLTQWLKE
jgi:hypothetical protein